MLTGKSSSRIDTEWIGSIIKACEISYESLALRMGCKEEPTKITYNGNMTTWGKIYNILRGVSQVTGLPMGNWGCKGSNCRSALHFLCRWDGNE